MGFEIFTAAANVVLFLVAAVAGLRVVYPVLFSVLQLGRVETGFQSPISEYQAIVLSISMAFVAFAVLARRWTAHLLNITVVSGVVFILAMVLLAQAIYLTDRGDPSMIWRVIRPKLPEYLGALWCSFAATLGWYLGGKLWRPADPITMMK